jgi:hypothetical protein
MLSLDDKLFWFASLIIIQDSNFREPECTSGDVNGFVGSDQTELLISMSMNFVAKKEDDLLQDPL